MSGYLLKFKQTYSVKIGGRRYPVVKIGNQLWMAENLDYKFDVNGSQIPIGPSGNPLTPTAWYYNNDESTYGIDGVKKCGLMYNWYAAKYLDDNKATLLPDGWHVPTLTEFDTLATAVGGASTAGTKLKALDNSIVVGFPSDWNGTDYYGFKILPSGIYYLGTFSGVGTRANMWSMTEGTFNPNANARNTYVNNTLEEIRFNENDKNTGFSLRLVKSLT